MDQTYKIRKPTLSKRKTTIQIIQKQNDVLEKCSSTHQNSKIQQKIYTSQNQDRSNLGSRRLVQRPRQNSSMISTKVKGQNKVVKTMTQNNSLKENRLCIKQFMNQIFERSVVLSEFVDEGKIDIKSLKNFLNDELFLVNLDITRNRLVGNDLDVKNFKQIQAFLRGKINDHILKLNTFKKCVKIQNKIQTMIQQRLKKLQTQFNNIH